MGSAFKSGFICLAGAPNVGKSTLMNRLVGRPVSITADRPQTTRTRILGLKTTGAHQAVFVDTPGIHDPTGPLNRRMVGYAHAALADADLNLMLMETLPAGAGQPGAATLGVLKAVRAAGARALLVITKIDLAGEKEILETIRWGGEQDFFAGILPLSAVSGRGVAELEQAVPGFLPEGPHYFEAGQVTDQSEEAIVAELIRQEIFRRTHQEVPYSTAVRVERMEEKKTLLAIDARIFVAWDSQKGILIGKKGAMLKAIGQGARKNIERLLGMKVFLGLEVAVLKDWNENPRHLADLGYPEN